MKVHFEPVVETVRLFHDDAEPFVSPYVGSATVVYSDNGKTAEIRGLSASERLPISVERAFRAAFDAKGVETVIWHRAGKAKQFFHV